MSGQDFFYISENTNIPEISVYYSIDHVDIEDSSPSWPPIDNMVIHKATYTLSVIHMLNWYEHYTFLWDIYKSNGALKFTAGNQSALMLSLYDLY